MSQSDYSTHVEIILSCDLIKMAECMTAKPALMRRLMMDKKMLIVEEVLEEPAVLLCESAGGLLLFRPTDPFHWTN